MVSTNDIRPGQSIIVDNIIYQIMEYAHVKPGKGKAFVKTKLKNMKDGGIIEKTFRADENVEQAFIDKKGRVKETLILKGVPNTGLDEAAMEAIRNTRFRPAKQRERSVGVWISIPVNFRLK